MKVMVLRLSVGFLHSPAATSSLLGMKMRALKTTYCLHPLCPVGIFILFTSCLDLTLSFSVPFSCVKFF